MHIARALKYARAKHGCFVQELQHFIRFPSVSTQPNHAADVKKCAEWLANHLQRIGLDRAQVIPTALHPIVYAEWLRDPGRPVLLIYGHYDVQPADPLSEWRSPPFAPQVRNGNLYGRGASDDKGQLFCHVKALEAHLHTTGRLPINVICLFEGEEEIGSTHLKPFIDRHCSALRANAAVISDTRILAPDRPAITHALRGSLSLELEVRVLRKDLHSGNFGGVVLNPIQALSEILTNLHLEDGMIAIPGFYDDVKVWGSQEREYMKRVGSTDKEILRAAGVSQDWGEPNFSLHERTTIRPALTINGITGGYQGSGGKGVIPARASAKISFRLVPDQHPGRAEQLFRQYVHYLAPPGVQVQVKRYFGSRPTILSRRHPTMQASALAYERGFGAKPVFLRSGGTIPVVNMFQDNLKIPTVLMGFALPDDAMHAPNEKFHLENFYHGIDTCIWFYTIIGNKRNA